jgi:N-acetylglucosaminyl-diphospho-decaprenol L-rhamnosyltransferase
VSPSPQTSWQRLSVVTVTHHSGAVIGDCLRSVAHAAEIIVIDNASADATRAIVAEVSPTAQIVHNPVGVGFGNGANLGLRIAKSEFVLLINPDALMREGAVEQLIAAADRYPEAAMLAPSIVDPAGRPVRSHDVGLFERLSLVPQANEPEPAGDLCSGYLSGAVMLLRTRALQAVGYFDPAIFLYYEDDDLCRRLRRAGWSLVLVRDAVAAHIGGGSIGSGLDRVWEKFWHMAWSRLYIEQKYAGSQAMRRIALPNLLRYTLKAIGDAIGFRKIQLVRDLARLCGTAAFLLGRQAGPNVNQPARVPEARTI